MFSVHPFNQFSKVWPGLKAPTFNMGDRVQWPNRYSADLACRRSGVQVKPMTYKIDTYRFLAWHPALIDRTWTGWLNVRIMWLSRISGHDTGGLISQCGSTIKSPWVHTFTSWCPSWYDLRCCKDIKLPKPTNPKHFEIVGSIPDWVYPKSYKNWNLSLPILVEQGKYWLDQCPVNATGLDIV